MSDTAKATVIGFDLGHAETALARTYGNSAAEPEPIPLAGAERGRPLLTLVGVRPDGSVLVGQDASSARPPVDLFTGFKSSDFEAAAVSRPLQMFIEKVVEDARARGHIPPDGEIRWIFGAPSGWSAEARKRYTSLLQKAGLRTVKVVPESRGALLHARDCGEVKLEAGHIRGCVLIVDIGSSTTDYTAVNNLRATPVEHGNIMLGASLIDAEIMRLVMRRDDLQPVVREVLKSCPSELRRLELLCRRAKEAYFSGPEELDNDPETERGVSGRLYNRDGRPVGVDVYLTRSDMDEVLSAPQEALGGRSWPAAFRADLQAALESLGRTPDVLLLTGGPAQMPFVVSICREAVGASRVLVGSAPEFAISRGLAIAGRVELKIEGLRRDVRRLLDSTEIAEIVSDRLPGLAKIIGDTIALGMTDRYVIPMFRKWHNGELDTLNAMTEQIGKKVNDDLLGGANSKLDTIVGNWQNGVQLRVEQKTRLICDRWGIPATVMALPPVHMTREGVAAPVDTAVVTGTLNRVGTAISAVVALVVANLLFGAGVAALAPTGPFFVLFAGVFILGGVLAGKERMLKKAMAVNIPLAVRRMMVSEESLERKLRAEAGAREGALADGIAEKILESKNDLAANIAHEVAVELEKEADEAERWISPPDADPEADAGDEAPSCSDSEKVTARPGAGEGPPESPAPSRQRVQRPAPGDPRRPGGPSAEGTASADGQGRFRLQAPDQLPTFAQVGGMEKVKAELNDTFGLLLAFSEEADTYRITFNGVLLHGPVGTGKTFLAQATAGEFGLNLVRVSIAELTSKFAGEFAQNVAAAFAYAAANVPCLLFFDEFDSVAARRDDEPNQENRRVVNQLLTSLEQYRSLRDLLVVAATNDLGRLDPAVVRPGRFDRHVRVDLPDLAAREAILTAQLAGRPTSPDLDVSPVARWSEGLTAAALTAVVGAGAMTAFRQATASGQRVPIATAHLLGALAARGGKDRPTVESWSWERVVLDDVTKTELRQLQLLLEDPDRAAAFGVEPPRGLLLAGPAGTGKTTVARVLAAESHCSFYPTTATDLTSKWVGESEAKVARLFARARDNAPSIVYIDEIDGVGAARGELGGSWADRLLNQLLAEIDGLASRSRVLVIGATNRPDILDVALTRGGRLSRTIWMGLPDTPARRQLLALHAARMPLHRVDLDRLAACTETLSGADLAELCQQAAVTAMTRMAARAAQPARPQVTMADFEVALTILQQSRQRLPGQRQDASMARFLDALTGARNIPQAAER